MVTIHHSCGHLAEYEVRGPSSKCQETIAWLTAQECRECRSRQGLITAQKRRELEGLPFLVGTPKQVHWAETIRMEALYAVNRFMAEREEEWAQCCDQPWNRRHWASRQQQDLWLHQENDASWWIDHRHNQEKAEWWLDCARKPPPEGTWLGEKA